MTKQKLTHIKSTGFKVPTNYFNKVSESISSQLSNVVSESVTLPKGDGFKAPENYFKSLEDEVFSQLDEPSETKVRKLSIQRKLYYISGIVAALFLWFGVFANSTETDEVSIEMVESYLEEKDLDSYELAELLIESELLELDDLTLEPEYDDQDIETYLLNHADLEQIIIQ